MAAQSAEIRIGISGWTYAPWRGQFFPKGLPRNRELAYASTFFRSIEINGTFYGLQTPSTFRSWAAQVPEDFVFAVKAPRFITHIKRARDVAIPIANFFASGVLALGPKLGPVLWQFPPNFHFDQSLMEEFLCVLPHDTGAASALARRHDDRLRARAWLKIDAVRPIRHAVEIRHQSFVDRAFVDLLRAHDVALVCADTVAWPRLMDLTSDFVYCRLHGSTDLYRSGYDAAALDEWAARIRAWSLGKSMCDGDFAGPAAGPMKRRDVFVFFDNTDKLRAPQDALALMKKLGLAPDQGERAA